MINNSAVEDYKRLMGLSLDDEMKRDLARIARFGEEIDKVLDDEELSSEKKAVSASKYVHAMESLTAKYRADNQTIKLGAVKLFQYIIDRAVEDDEQGVIDYLGKLTEEGLDV